MMSQTIESTVDALKLLENQRLPLFVQVGYNRYDIVSYGVRDGYCVLCIAEEANNPIPTILHTDPDGVAA
jgi:hypothetical protein